LKWLRRAEQDYEYLWLARERGQVINARWLARAITKPVEIAAGELPDPAYSLMSGTADQGAWAEAQRLLAKSILLRAPGQQADKGEELALNIQTLQWAAPQERPLMVGRTTRWTTEPAAAGAGKGAAASVLRLRLGLDIYNASELTPDENQLQWTSLPP